MPVASVLVDAGAARRALLDLYAWADELRLAYAWASGRGAPAAHWEDLPAAKIQRAVIGLHFDRTDPDVLRELQAQRVSLRVWRQFDAVFHPKVVVGVRGTRARALIGSSNLTSGGFGANVEANVLLSGRATDPAIARVRAAIDRWWRGGLPVTEAWLEEYEGRFQARARLERHWRAESGAPDDELPVDLDLSWSTFFGRLRTVSATFDVLGGGADGETYGLAEAERCHRPFAAGARFREIDVEERRIIGGYGRDGTGWFGPIRHRGVMRWVRDEGAAIGQRLDRVPLRGTAEQALGPARRFLRWALEQRYVGIGSASRLLMAKRPDLFVCLNAANAERLKEQFGVRIHDADGYLALHRRIWQLSWYRAARPRDPLQRRVWHVRAALLDALLYDDAPPIARVSLR